MGSSVPALVPSAPRLPRSPPAATSPSTRCTTPPATSPSSSPSPHPTPTTSTSPLLQPWRLRRLHRPLQLLQGLHQRQLRHPEHARRLKGPRGRGRTCGSQPRHASPCLPPNARKFHLV